MIDVTGFKVVCTIVAPAPEIKVSGVQLAELSSDGAVLVSTDTRLAKARVLRLSIQAPGQERVLQATGNLRAQPSDLEIVHTQVVYRIRFTYLSSKDRRLLQQLEREPAEASILDPSPRKKLGDAYIIRYGSRAAILETTDTSIQRAKVVALQIPPLKGAADRQGPISLTGRVEIINGLGADGSIRFKANFADPNPQEMARYLELIKKKTAQGAPQVVSGRIFASMAKIKPRTKKLLAGLVLFLIVAAVLLWNVVLKSQIDPFPNLRVYDQQLGHYLIKETLKLLESHKKQTKLQVAVVLFNGDDFEMQNLKAGLNEEILLHKAGLEQIECVDLQIKDRYMGTLHPDGRVMDEDIQALVTSHPTLDAIISLSGFPATSPREIKTSNGSLVLVGYETVPTTTSLAWIQGKNAAMLVTPRVDYKRATLPLLSPSDEENIKSFFAVTTGDINIAEYNNAIIERAKR